MTIMKRTLFLTSHKGEKDKSERGGVCVRARSGVIQSGTEINAGRWQSESKRAFTGIRILHVSNMPVSKRA